MSRYLGTRGRSSLAVSVCDRCQLKVRYVDLMADGNSPGLRVCRKCHDPIDRWRLPPRQTETISLQHPRPEQNIQADQPVASFTMSPVSGYAPLSVTFTDTSTGSPTGWSWDFNGDGVIDSTIQNPTYVYTSPGLYSVTLVTSNASGSAQARVLAAVQVLQPADQYWAYVILLMHFDGDYVDSSTLGQAFTSSGATLSATNAKFVQSASINGTNPGGGGSNKIESTGASTAYDLTTGDYTLEGWVRPDSTATNGGGVRPIVSCTTSGSGVSSGGVALSLYGDATGTFARFDYSGVVTIQSSASSVYLTTGTWYHVAATKQGTTYRLFVNGVQVAASTDPTTATAAARRATVGNLAGLNQGLHGAVDEVRITKGVARYTATFTPPTAAFPNN